jgi:hypothetical protein
LPALQRWELDSNHDQGVTGGKTRGFQYSKRETIKVVLEVKIKGRREKRHTRNRFETPGKKKKNPPPYPQNVENKPPRETVQG